MDKTSRRHHTPEQKVCTLRLHLLEGRPISEVCEAEGIHPTPFYQWEKTSFEKGTAAFENGRFPAQIQVLEGPLRQGQRPQPHDPSRPLERAMGTGCQHLLCHQAITRGTLALVLLSRTSLSI